MPDTHSEPTTTPVPPAPRPPLDSARPYRANPRRAQCDLLLDANEGPPPSPALWGALASSSAELLRRYPSAAALESELGARFGIDAERVLVTAGGDDAIDRLCRTFLSPDRGIVYADPTFEMIERYADLAGAERRPVAWDASADYPLAAVLNRADDDIGIIAAVTPNNPTGRVIPTPDLLALADHAERIGAVLLADLAYAEFDPGEDPTPQLIERPNTVIVRTFSKAWGLAGARVGYALGPAALLVAMRAAGGPFAVSGPSAALALAALCHAEAAMRETVRAVNDAREAINDTMRSVGAEVADSAANFSYARFGNAERSLWCRDALFGLGIAIRAFTDRPALDGALRISAPTKPADTERLIAALRAALAPQAILFDLDGVIADVASSYRWAIVETARMYGVEVTPRDIALAKAEGDANNDWVLTHALVTRRGIQTTLEEVTRRFESVYQGEGNTPGLWTRETLLTDPALFDRLAERVRLAIVTGRPRRDAERFLAQHNLEGRFEVIVTMEDGPPKPDPAPVRAALERLGVRHAWMVGDTPDDARAAWRAGAVPIGVLPPGDEPALARAGLENARVARILNDLTELEALLP